MQKQIDLYNKYDVELKERFFKQYNIKYEKKSRYIFF